jgi:hypothetical protein
MQPPGTDKDCLEQGSPVEQQADYVQVLQLDHSQSRSLIVGCWLRGRA